MCDVYQNSIETLMQKDHSVSLAFSRMGTFLNNTPYTVFYRCFMGPWHHF